jgi:molybdopterin-guanine dinucleotide biosynthesis protein A
MFPIILPLSDLLKEYLTKVLISPHNKQRSLFRLIKTLKLQSINAPPEKLFRFKNSNTQQQWNDCLKDHQQLKMLNKPN